MCNPSENQASDQYDREKLETVAVALGFRPTPSSTNASTFIAICALLLSGFATFAAMSLQLKPYKSLDVAESIIRKTNTFGASFQQQQEAQLRLDIAALLKEHYPVDDDGMFFYYLFLGSLCLLTLAGVGLLLATMFRERHGPFVRLVIEVCALKAMASARSLRNGKTKGTVKTEIKNAMKAVETDVSSLGVRSFLFYVPTSELTEKEWERISYVFFHLGIIEGENDLK